MKKNWNKYFRLLALPIIACGLFATGSYAQSTQDEEVSGVLKVYGGGGTKATFNVMNYPGEAGFSPSKILMGTATNTEPKVVFEVNTKLGLEKNMMLEDNKVKLALETGLSNQGKANLRKAFAEFKSWMVGFQVSNFCDPSILPGTEEMPNSAVAKRAVQLKFQHPINESFSYAVSVEEAAKFDLYPGKKEEEKKNMPQKPNRDIPVGTISMKYTYPNALGHLHVGLLGGALSCYDKNKSQYLPAFGANVGTEYKLQPQTSLKGHVVYGQGVGGYIGDLANLAEKEVNTAYLKAKSSELNTIQAWGGYAAVEHRWVPQLGSTLAGSLLRTIEDQNRTSKQHYKTGVFVAANIMYYPTEQVHVGVEIVHGVRVNIDDKYAQANRVQAVAGFKF